jgi:hypothetical protein
MKTLWLGTKLRSHTIYAINLFNDLLKFFSIQCIYSSSLSLEVDWNCITVSQTFTSRLQRLRQEGEFFDFERTNDYIKKSTKFGVRLFGFSFTATVWVALVIPLFGALSSGSIIGLLCYSS